MIQQDSRLTRLPLLILVLVTWMSRRAPATNPGELTWQSAATGGEIHGQVHLPAHPEGALPTVTYLKNLAIPRIGLEPDEPIIADLVKAGYLVLVLDYAHHPKAISPDLNADMLKLRQDVTDAKMKSLLADYNIDPNHLFILVEGFRLKRDVEFARDVTRVLGMDIIYPSKPSKPVPMLMEITCDNANRMGSSSLLFCHDTLLEGAEAAGFAVAMVDHPVAPPYKGLDDPMPQSLERMKSAVKVLRDLHGELGTSEKIGAIGFSRGGPFAAMLAADGTVNAALVHGNRYDYLDLLPNDPMLPRFERAWGKVGDNKDRWAAHGASMYLTREASPMFLDTSDTESPEYRDGLAKLDQRLTKLGIEHTYQIDVDGRGHRVSTNPRTIRSFYSFFHEHLD